MYCIPGRKMGKPNMVWSGVGLVVRKSGTFWSQAELSNACLCEMHLLSLTKEDPDGALRWWLLWWEMARRFGPTNARFQREVCEKSWLRCHRFSVVQITTAHGLVLSRKALAVEWLERNQLSNCGTLEPMRSTQASSGASQVIGLIQERWEVQPQDVILECPYCYEVTSHGFLMPHSWRIRPDITITPASLHVEELVVDVICGECRVLWSW